MKIGKLNFRDYAAKKPLSISPEGKFLTAADLVGKTTRSATLRLGSLHTLDAGMQKKLALQRYQLEPDFKLGKLGHGEFTKAEILEHIQNDTEFGRLAVRVEMAYCNTLIASLGDGSVAAWPRLSSSPTRPAPSPRRPKDCVLLKLQTRAVFCENTTDAITGPIAAYRIANVHPAFAARGFIVVPLTDVNDTRLNFVPEAKNQATGYIGGVGHGNVDIFTGDQTSMILQVGAYDPTEVSGKGLHLFSCLTSTQLAPDAVHHGAKFYAGYNANFFFIWDNPGTPVNEFELFVGADSTFDIWIANGKTAKQAFDATRQAFTAAMAQVPGSAAASWLQFNRDHFVLNGDQRATVPPNVYVKVCYPIPPDQQRKLAAAASPVE